MARALLARLPNSVWLDGDDVWRMNPFRVDPTTTSMVESNIRFVLKNFLTSGFSDVIFSWVLHRQEIIDSILGGLSGLDHELFVFTLVCDEEILRRRFQGDPGKVSLALRRLQESKELLTTKIDVTEKSAEEVATEIVGVTSPG